MKKCTSREFRRNGAIWLETIWVLFGQGVHYSQVFSGAEHQAWMKNDLNVNMAILFVRGIFWRESFLGNLKPSNIKLCCGLNLSLVCKIVSDENNEEALVESWIVHHPPSFQKFFQEYFLLGPLSMPKVSK